MATRCRSEIRPGRVEDDALLRGQGRYGDDVKPQGALAAYFVRSPHAFAKIEHVDVAAAKSAKGVVAVFTAADLAAGALSFDLARASDPRPRRQAAGLAASAGARESA